MTQICHNYDFRYAQTKLTYGKLPSDLVRCRIWPSMTLVKLESRLYIYGCVAKGLLPPQLVTSFTLQA